MITPPSPGSVPPPLVEPGVRALLELMAHNPEAASGAALVYAEMIDEAREVFLDAMEPLVEQRPLRALGLLPLLGFESSGPRRERIVTLLAEAVVREPAGLRAALLPFTELFSVCAA